jgi:hypothetical protein
MMLLALTVERYVSVCHPGSTQPVMGPPRLIVSLIPPFTFLLYLPYVFRYQLRPCSATPEGTVFYQREHNRQLLTSVFYPVYKVCGVWKLESTFRRPLMSPSSRATSPIFIPVYQNSAFTYLC